MGLERRLKNWCNQHLNFINLEIKFTRGKSRNVIILFGHVFKFPRNRLGLCANINECIKWKEREDKKHLMCPIIFGNSFLLYTLPCKILTADEAHLVTGELKTLTSDTTYWNYGYLQKGPNKGKLVCIDYGDDVKIPT